MVFPDVIIEMLTNKKKVRYRVIVLFILQIIIQII